MNLSPTDWLTLALVVISRSSGFQFLVRDVFGEILEAAIEITTESVEVIRKRAVSPLVDHLGEGDPAYASSFRKLHQRHATTVAELLFSQELLYAIANHCLRSLTDAKINLHSASLFVKLVLR